jgi:hypothetical protein
MTSPWEGFSLAVRIEAEEKTSGGIIIPERDHDAVVKRTEFHAILLVGFYDYFLDWQLQ